MLFKPVKMSNMPEIKSFFDTVKGENIRPCDFSLGCTFMWRKLFGARYTILNESLIFEFFGSDEEYGYTYPFGGKPDEAAEELISLLGHMRFCLLTHNELTHLMSRHPDGKSETNRDWYDYIYNAEDIKTLQGNRFSGQRNHINKFYRLYPESHFEEITDRNIGDAVDFAKKYYETNPPQTKNLQAEREAVFEVFDNYKSYSQLGGLLYADNEAAGFSFGETVGDTLIIHAEKADRRFEGAYPALVNAYAKHFCREDTHFINREEDCGDEGLRISKLSYHPCRLLEKWNLIL